MRCAQHIGRVAGAVLLAFGVSAFVASAALGQSDDQGVTDPSGLSFSLPEGTDSPVYQEPLHGNTHSSGPTIHSYYGQGFASDDVINQHVGDIHISMDKCTTPENGFDERVVRVELEKSNYAWAKVVDGLLLRAAEFAWHNCARTYNHWIANGLDYFYNIHEVDIYTPDGQPVIRAELGAGYTGDGSMTSQHDYPWTVVDLGAQRKQEAAQLAQQQALAAQRAAWEQQRDADAAAGWATAGKVFRTILLLLAAGLLFWMREPIARWYYFMFHPHPAAPAIRSALASGTVMDGKRLATILGEAPADGRILRAVRAEQAQALIVEMQSMTQARIRELEARAKEQYEHAAAQQLQAALAQAAVVHEQAKAMLNATQGASR
jgi:hypothetical protein